CEYGITAWLSTSKKLVYQTLIRAKSTGRLTSKSSFLKCVSILWAPKSNFSKLSYPTERLMDNPTVLHKENRPPTQSHMGKMLSSAIPNCFTFSRFVDTATKCFA